MLKTSQKIPFEIHLTIGNLPTEAMSRFIELCAEADGKALIIELARGNQRQQPMFSKKIRSKSPAEAIRSAETCAKKFTLNNFSNQSNKDRNACGICGICGGR